MSQRHLQVSFSLAKLSSSSCATPRPSRRRDPSSQTCENGAGNTSKGSEKDHKWTPFGCQESSRMSERFYLFSWVRGRIKCWDAFTRFYPCDRIWGSQQFCQIWILFHHKSIEPELHPNSPPTLSIFWWTTHHSKTRHLYRLQLLVCFQCIIFTVQGPAHQACPSVLSDHQTTYLSG